MPDSPFRRLARTHALMAMGDASMYGALAGSVLFNLSPDAQREKVLLYLLISVAPFAVVAPAIGPTVDRIPGGRRMVMQITAVCRAVFYVIMAFQGMTLSGFPPLQILVWPEFFGRMHIGSIICVTSLFTTIAGALGPVIAGVAYDQTGSYEVTIWMLVATWVATAGVMLVVKPASHREDPVGSHKRKQKRRSLSPYR